MRSIMTRRLSCVAATLAFPLAAACATSWLNLAHAQSSEDDVLGREIVWRDPEVPALGNPDGDLTLVEYFDYQCPVCKGIHPELSRAVHADGKVRLVSKGWPIFGGASAYAARMALAAKYQGKFAQAHEALFAAKAPLTEVLIRELLSKADVDSARAASDLQANLRAIDATLARNETQAVAFGFQGTPAFIVGTFRVNGGLDAAGFKQVIAAARAAQTKR
jgi:protein-disulfide isomerase